MTSNDYRRNVDFYAVGHSSAFVTAGYQRVTTVVTGDVIATAYRYGNEVAVVLQNMFWDKARNVAVKVNGKTFILPKAEKEASVTIKLHL